MEKNILMCSICFKNLFLRTLKLNFCNFFILKNPLLLATWHPKKTPIIKIITFLQKVIIDKKRSKFEAKWIDILKVTAIWLPVVIKSSFLPGKYWKFYSVVKGLNSLFRIDVFLRLCWCYAINIQTKLIAQNLNI